MTVTSAERSGGRCDLDAELLAGLIAIVGADFALLPGRDDLSAYLHEPRGALIGATPVVLKPDSVEQTAAIVSFAAAHGLAIVPQGGRTGLVGGATPSPSGGEIAVSMERMNRIRSVDSQGESMIVEAGVTLEQAQRAAERVGLSFPLSLGSQGSCQIGGAVSTNAGGVHVLAYGSMRELTLGLEVVLPNGAIWRGLRCLGKDNAGYALRHLFIGAEGTLGIVAAALRLHPAPVGRETAFAGVPDPEAALRLLEIARKRCGRGGLVAFELMSRQALSLVWRHIDGARDPLPGSHPWCVLLEVVDPCRSEAARMTIEAILVEAAAASHASGAVVADAVVAASGDQARRFWRMRESIPHAQTLEGASIKHDISLPIRELPTFIRRAAAAVAAVEPAARLCTFGHMGDGNLHYNVSQPSGGDPQDFLGRKADIENAVHELTMTMGGSISAEHGIGVFKRDLLRRAKSREEYELMRVVKAAIDPRGTLNPGRILTRILTGPDKASEPDETASNEESR